MALLGLSLILASVVYLAIRQPPLIQTLIALWRRDPRIGRGEDGQGEEGQDAHDGGREHLAAREKTGNAPPARPRGNSRGAVLNTTTVLDEKNDPPPAPTPAMPQVEQTDLARPAMPSPPDIEERQPAASPSPETTPKASAATPASDSAVPSFSLDVPEPPASAAAVSRASHHTETTAPSPTMPSLSSPQPAPLAPPASSLMPPPPRPPKLNGVNNSSGLLSPSPSPARSPNGPLPNRSQFAAQPGTSTLAPPPTHSAKPAKPRKKVMLTPGHSPLDWARLANGPTSDLRGLPPSTPYLKVTPSMLKRQTGRRGKDAWTALGGRVYNITPYMPYHPGGEPELLRAAGRDGTKLFGEIHPWVNYEGMLASSMVGMLVEEHEAAGNEMDDMD